MRYIFFTFSFIFFSVKKVFFSKKIFNIKLFFHIKTFFSANNVYFVKNTNIFSKKKFFFQLSFATNEQPQPIAYRFKLRTCVMSYRHKIEKIYQNQLKSSQTSWLWFVKRSSSLSFKCTKQSRKQSIVWVFLYGVIQR